MRKIATSVPTAALVLVSPAATTMPPAMVHAAPPDDATKKPTRPEVRPARPDVRPTRAQDLAVSAYRRGAIDVFTVVYSGPPIAKGAMGIVVKSPAGMKTVSWTGPAPWKCSPKMKGPFSWEYGPHPFGCDYIGMPIKPGVVGTFVMKFEGTPKGPNCATVTLDVAYEGTSGYELVKEKNTKNNKACVK